ncbi:hypothetical protein RUM43_005751 [Polyplax serrata]|uniref:Uncharacterized protein n=1 Tax=Polyplax serrata TaxID=468196 RepID=A0AAN8P0F0_POLSC
MNKKEDISMLAVKALPVFKSTTEIARTASVRHFQVIELTEYFAESNLKELDAKIRLLTAAKMESEKMRSDYITRNEINLRNSDSLLQAKNQLCKYKCELKSEYITMQQAVKAKKMKYDKIVSSYESEWQKNLVQYNADPVVIELTKIKEENLNLENKTSALEKLIPDSQRLHCELEATVNSKFQSKVIEFCRQMMAYESFIETQRKKKNDKIKEEGEGKETTAASKNSFFEWTKLSLQEKSEEVCLTPLDILEFDNLIIPVEKLEKEKDDEFTLFLLSGVGKNNENGNSKEMSSDPLVNARPEPEVETGKPSGSETTEAKTAESSEKTLDASGNESRYFNPFVQQSMKTCQPSKKGEVPVEDDGNVQKRTKMSEKVPEPGTGKETKNPEGLSLFKTYEKGNKMDVDERSNGSFENQFGFNVQNKSSEVKPTSECEGTVPETPLPKPFHYHYNSVLSMGAKDVSLPLSTDNFNDSPRSPVSIRNLKSDDDKDGFKSFKGFFTMGDEPNSPTPSIFKLF